LATNLANKNKLGQQQQQTWPTRTILANKNKLGQRQNWLTANVANDKIGQQQQTLGQQQQT